MGQVVELSVCDSEGVEGADPRGFETPFERDVDYDGDRLLCRSARFTVRSWWETVALEGEDLAGPVIIGDFWANPFGAAIDLEERWCVMVGSGLVVYRLAAPWVPYEYDVVSNQWWEYGRRSSERVWFDSVSAAADGRFRCVTPPDEQWMVEEFTVDPDVQAVSPRRQWIEAGLRDRTRLLQSFVGQRLVEVVADDRLELRFGDGGEYRLMIVGGLTVQNSSSPADSIVTTGSAASATALPARLNTLMSERVRQLDLSPNGTLFLNLETPGSRAAGVRLGTRQFHLHTTKGEAAGAWEVLSPTGRLRWPGPGGWPTDRP